MLTDADILTSLSEVLSPGELSHALQKILRIPQAWQYLHQQETLNKVIAQGAKEYVVPSRLALLALGQDGDASYEIPLNPELEERHRTLLEAIHTGETREDLTFKDIVLLGKDLVDHEPEQIAQLIMNSPSCWRAPLAIVWPYLPNPNRITDALIADGNSEALEAVLNAVQANLVTSESAQTLLSIFGDGASELLSMLMDIGELALAHDFAEAMRGTRQDESASPSAIDLLRHGLELKAGSRYDDARGSLERAWEQAHQLAADAADQLADIARIEEDHVYEVEATGQALEVYPTVDRRARHARALLHMGRLDEVFNRLPETNPSSIDRIVLAQAFAQSGDRAQARQTILTAHKDLHAEQPIKTPWLVELIDTLDELGLTSQALAAAGELLQQEPTSVSVRVRFAHILGKAGQKQQAIEQSRLCLSLEPDSMSARTCLAKWLQASGDFESALPMWMSLSDEAPNYKTDLIACALEAGYVDLAVEHAEAFFSKHPDSPQAAVMLANAKKAAGDIAVAIDLLEQVIDGGAASGETWITLASCRAELDESAYAMTLAAGIQAQPGSPKIHFAYAQHLLSNGEHSQALNHLKKAVDIAPEEASFNDAYGSLLIQLGHLHQALPYLEEAVTREPGNWRSRARLADAYVQVDRLQEAADLLVDLPEASDAELHIEAGKILTRACLEIEPEYAQAALKAFKIAEQKDADDTLMDLWSAQAMEQAGQYEQALARYQDFIRHNPTDDQNARVEAILGQGRVALALGQTSLAISLLEQARESQPNSADILMLLAKAYQQENLTQQAVECAQQAVETAPGNPTALQILADIEESRKSWKSAVEVTQRWAEAEPENIDAWLSLADRAWNADFEPTYRMAVAKAVWLSRSLPSELIRTAHRLRDYGATSIAKRALHRAVGQATNLPFTTLKRLAQFAEELEDHETACSAWVELSAQAPNDPQILANAASSLWVTGRKQEAITHWQKAVDQDGENAAHRVQLANARVQNGDIQDGLELYMNAASLEPGNAQIALEVGRAFAKYGTKEEAIDYLRRAVELNPSDLDSQLALAKTMFELGRMEESLDVLDRILDVHPSSVQACAMAAAVNLVLGRYPVAKEHLKKAESKKGISPSDAKWMARAELRFGNWALAFEHYIQTLSEEPEPKLQVEFVKTLLRMLDATWLYADYSNAFAHAPTFALAAQDLHKQLELLLEKLEQMDDPPADISDLKCWWQLHNPDEREAALNALHGPNHPRPTAEVAHAIAVAHLNLAQSDLALQSLENSVDAFNPDAWGGLLIGIARSMRGERDRAREAFNTARENPIVRPLARYLEGRAWLMEDDSDRAIQAMSEALGAWPNEPAWQYELGSLYASEGNFDAALPHLQQAVELDPDDHEATIELARILRRMGQLHEAEPIYARAIQSRPADGDIWKEAAQVSLAVGKPEQAQDWFERAQTLSPSDAQCIIGAAKAALELGNPRKAAELSVKAARMAPDDLDVLLGIGEIQSRQGKYEKALEVYDRALGISDDPLTVQLSRAKVLTQIGRPGQAVGDLRLTLERAPEDHRIWAALAQACEADDDIEYALDAATKALRLSPLDPVYQMLVGRLARKHGQLDIALDQIVQAKSMLPHSPLVHYELGRIYEERRQHSNALAAFQEALRLDPQNRDAFFHSGLVLKQLKAYQDAGRMFEKVVTMHPRDPEALHQLAAVRALQLVHGGIPQTAVTT